MKIARAIGTIAVLLAVFALGGCASRSVEQVADRGLVVFRVEPSSAQVWINGEKAGEASDFDGRVKVLELDGGRHHLELRKDGYVTHSQELVVGSGVKQTIRVSLDRVE